MFGCLCYPWLATYINNKLVPRSQPCIFLGYSLTQSAYLCFNPAIQKLYTSRYVQFVETIFPYPQSHLILFPFKLKFRHHLSYLLHNSSNEPSTFQIQNFILSPTNRRLLSPRSNNHFQFKFFNFHSLSSNLSSSYSRILLRLTICFHSTT